MNRPLHIALLALALAAAQTARADESTQPVAMKQVDIEEHLGEKLPLDLPFVDQDGKAVKLGDYFHGKPVVLSLVYFKCPMLCSLVLSGQARVMRDMALGLGKDYEALTVSFDPEDGPKDAEFKQHNYLQAMGSPGQKADWPFLTGKADAISQLTRAVGFKYYFDEASQTFAHAAALFVITPDGKISRYVYQVSFEPKQLKLALVEAGQGKAGSSLDRSILSCYRYDLTAKKYKLYVSRFITTGALLVFAVLAIFLGRLWYREYKRKFVPNGKWAS